MLTSNLRLRIALGFLTLVFPASIVSAANSFSNSLTGFTGDSTVPATVSAVAAAGFNFSDAGVGDAAAPDPSVYKVKFGTSGATFGDLQPVNFARNYMRSTATDYANTSFVAEVTITSTDIDNQNVYFGLGSGEANNDFFRTPDYQTSAASIMYWGENEVATPTIEVVRNNDGHGADVSETAAPALDNGTYRVRLTYDWFAKTATFAFDFNYAGGAFNADFTAPSADVLPLYSSGTGFPQEPGRIFFGGDSGGSADVPIAGPVFKDFQVTVSGPSVVFGDFDSSGGPVTAADWAILRSNKEKEVSGLSHQQAYFLGDLTADLKIDHDDFVVFKSLYEAAHGTGSFAQMLASVPEPSTLCLLLICGLAIGRGPRRRMFRA
jgi:hypothetical protein